MKSRFFTGDLPSPFSLLPHPTPTPNFPWSLMSTSGPAGFGLTGLLFHRQGSHSRDQQPEGSVQRQWHNKLFQDNSVLSGLLWACGCCRFRHYGQDRVCGNTASRTQSFSKSATTRTGVVSSTVGTSRHLLLPTRIGFHSEATNCAHLLPSTYTGVESV